MDVNILSGDFLSPIQLLNDQKYDGHKSLHDEAMAESLGFSGAPIEGCTHLSQFVPLLEKIYKNQWFISGCISVHYKNMVFEDLKKNKIDNIVEMYKHKKLDIYGIQWHPERVNAPKIFDHKFLTSFLKI